jgi:hypothetical protein
MGLLEIELSVVDWIRLAQDRYRWRALVNAVMNLWVAKTAGNLPSGCTTCGLSSGTQLHRVSYVKALFLSPYSLAVYVFIKNKLRGP